MPVFLLPIMVGGYYYLKNKKDDLQGNETGDSDDSAETPRSSADAEAAEEDIEVSLVMDSERQRCDDGNNDDQPRQSQHSQHPATSAAASSEESISVRTQVLTRRESSDTVQSETSVSAELLVHNEHQQQQPPATVHPSYSLDMLSSCGDCDQEGLFEIVDCGSNHDCDTHNQGVSVWA